MTEEFNRIFFKPAKEHGELLNKFEEKWGAEDTRALCNARIPSSDLRLQELAEELDDAMYKRDLLAQLLEKFSEINETAS